MSRTKTVSFQSNKISSSQESLLTEFCPLLLSLRGNKLIISQVAFVGDGERSGVARSGVARSGVARSGVAAKRLEEVTPLGVMLKRRRTVGRADGDRGGVPRLWLLESIMLALVMAASSKNRLIAIRKLVGYGTIVLERTAKKCVFVSQYHWYHIEKTHNKRFLILRCVRQKNQQRLSALTEL